MSRFSVEIFCLTVPKNLKIYIDIYSTGFLISFKTLMEIIIYNYLNCLKSYIGSWFRFSIFSFPNWWKQQKSMYWKDFKVILSNGFCFNFVKVSRRTIIYANWSQLHRFSFNFFQKQCCLEVAKNEINYVFRWFTKLSIQGFFVNLHHQSVIQIWEIDFLGIKNQIWIAQVLQLSSPKGAYFQHYVLSSVVSPVLLSRKKMKKTDEN